MIVHDQDEALGETKWRSEFLIREIHIQKSETNRKQTYSRVFINFISESFVCLWFQRLVSESLEKEKKWKGMRKKKTKQVLEVLQSALRAK